MTKKLVSIILCIALAISGCIGMSSCSQDESYNESTAQQEFIDELVNSAIEEADIRIEDYFDVSYYVNLGEVNSTTTTNHILTKSICSDDEIYIDAIQYDELTSSISEIFDELTDEEYEAIKTLAEEDSDIADMLYMVESDFEGYGYETETSDVSISAANIALTSATIATVGSILLSQGVNSAAVVAIKGAFNTMVATLKAFFLTNSAKAVIVTAAILVIATVVIINWNKIKPVFTQIVDVFVDNAKKLASTVTNVFNSIYNKAIVSSISEGIKAIFTDDIKNDMAKYGISQTIMAALIKEFTNVDINNDNGNKTVYLGKTEDEYDKIAENNDGIAFHVSDARWRELLEKYKQDGLWCINKVFLKYVIYKRWDIILVSNPNSCYNIITQTKLNDRTYARELEYLCKDNGATWHSELDYWRIDKAW